MFETSVTYLLSGTLKSLLNFSKAGLFKISLKLVSLKFHSIWLANMSITLMENVLNAFVV